MSHKEYDDIEGWVTNVNNKHPLITVAIEVSEEDCDKFGHKLPRRKLNSVNRIAVADTGAMAMVAGRELVSGLGLTLILSLST